MNINSKYAIGVHIMFYEIEILPYYVDGLINMLSTVSNGENIHLDFAFNVSQFFEKIDTNLISKSQLIEKFFEQYNRIPDKFNKTYKIVDNDNEFYTQTNYRREFNLNYCTKVDYLIWGETDSLFPKPAIICLEHLSNETKKQELYRYIACFADRKMWDNSWDVTVHPNYLNHVYDENDVDNKNQAKSALSLDELNKINDNLSNIDVQSINYPKIDGSCLVISSDLVKSGVNIPPCFIHNDDESLSLMATKHLGNNYVQIIFKNVLKVHARRHPKKRLYVLNENNPIGFCGNQKGDWWQLFKNMSQHNISVLFNNQGKFYTFEDFKKQL